MFADLEDCQLAWAKASDPLALCVAVTKADLPEWLADALLVWLFAGGGSGDVARMFPFREYWESRHAEALDATRALTALAVRGVDARPRRTSEEAFGMVAEYLADRLGTETVGPDAVRKSLERVEGNLSDEGRYWKADRGLADRLMAALGRRAGRM